MPPDEPPVTAQAIADAAVDASAGAPSVEEIDVLKRVVETLTDFLTSYSLQIVGALVVLVLGTIVARILSHILLRFLERRNFDVTLSRFIASCMRGSVVGFAFVVALGKFGITIAPILAALGALAFGASIAVQGPLSNFGSGLAIIFLRPFVVDDTVAVSGVEGVVVEVKLGYTVLCDEDGIEIIVPNKEVFGQVMHNSKGRRLVEGVIGISYGDAPREAISGHREDYCSRRRRSPRPAAAGRCRRVRRLIGKHSLSLLGLYAELLRGHVHRESRSLRWPS